MTCGERTVCWAERSSEELAESLGYSRSFIIKRVINLLCSKYGLTYDEADSLVREHVFKRSSKTDE